MLEKQLRDGADSYSLLRLIPYKPTPWDVTTQPAILHAVEDLIGPNIVAWGTQYFCKLPRDGKPVSWRQAEGYGDPVGLELKAGEISLHADMLVHGSEPDQSS